MTEISNINVSAVADLLFSTLLFIFRRSTCSITQCNCSKAAVDQSVCSSGRPGGTRTPNPRFWRPMLCQLSYWPFITASNQKAGDLNGPPASCNSTYFNMSYSKILATTPAPTVRPPSRIAKRRPSSIAIGAISSTFICTLSPGITISTPSGNVTAPVTSVVRK